MAKKVWKLGNGSRIDVPASECAIDLSTGLPDMVRDKRGIRKGRLVAQEFAGFQAYSKQRRAIWLCLCDCGNTICAPMSPSDRARSCGCLHRDVHTSHGASGQGANLAEAQVYRAWETKLQQCYNPNLASYPNIGGRGIKMCDRWVNDFPAFLEDVGLPPTPDHVLSRLDYDKDYEPSNVRWIDKIKLYKKSTARSLQQHYKDNPRPSDDQLILLAKKYPNATAQEYCKLLADLTGARLSRINILRRLKKLDLSRRKQRCALLSPDGNTLSD
jgi:hypothetical protein